MELAFHSLSLQQIELYMFFYCELCELVRRRAASTYCRSGNNFLQWWGVLMVVHNTVVLKLEPLFVSVLAWSVPKKCPNTVVQTVLLLYN